MAIAIPERYRAALTALADLSDQDFQAFAGALDGAETTLTPADLKAQLEGHLPADLDGVDALIGLEHTRRWRDWDLETLVTETAESHELTLTGEQRTALATRLRVVLGSRVLRLVAKAVSLRTQQERTFGGVHIFSDLRPVFGDSTAEPPVGSVLLHTLALDFFENGDLKSFYVALDSEDVEKLAAEVARAQEKVSTLKEWLAAEHMAVLEGLS